MYSQSIQLLQIATLANEASLVDRQAVGWAAYPAGAVILTDSIESLLLLLFICYPSTSGTLLSSLDAGPTDRTVSKM